MLGVVSLKIVIIISHPREKNNRYYKYFPNRLLFMWNCAILNASIGLDVRRNERSDGGMHFLFKIFFNEVFYAKQRKM